jgi:hypothetical protein
MWTAGKLFPRHVKWLSLHRDCVYESCSDVQQDFSERSRKYLNLQDGRFERSSRQVGPAEIRTASGADITTIEDPVNEVDPTCLKIRA